MKNQIYYDQNFDISKKLIDYHMEIEEFKYDLEENQKVITNEIISILKQKGIDEYRGEYCYAKLKKVENKKIKYSKYIDKLIEYEYDYLLDIIEGKKLLEYMTYNENAMNLYRKYKSQKDIDSKLALINELKNKNKFDLMKFNLDDIKNIYCNKNILDKKREYLKMIIDDNESVDLIYDYIY